MSVSRRAFLGALLGTVAVSGCSQAVDRLTQPKLPDNLLVPSGADRHPIAHLLNRATYGPRPGQVADVERVGKERWLRRQLDYDSINDKEVDWKLRRFDSLQMRSEDLMSFGRNQTFIVNELVQATILRAVYSKRELFEVMVGFWSDHFSINHFKDTDTVIFLKTIDDRDVIRRHTLGKFSDLLKASAHSPAMLHYLDNTANEKSHPNENYAREIMELHTLGVDGGYTETDIQEVARCLTGWSISGRGHFTFREEWHDDGKKVVLGQEIPAGGGRKDGDKVLDILINHPSTARFVSTKLVRRFVADDPPPNMIDACVQTWQATGGDIKQIMFTLFTHPDFEQAPPKLKRPYELLLSILRTTNARYDGDDGLIDWLVRLGHRPFGWVTPDGFPDVADIWANNLFGYWQLERAALHNELSGVDLDIWDIAKHVGVDDKADKMIDFFGRMFYSRTLNPTEEAAIKGFYSDSGRFSQDLSKDTNRRRMLDTLMILIAGPAFQYR